MQNARLDEAQDGIKIAGEITTTSDNADDTILVTEIEEEPKSPLDEGERGE